MTVHGDREPQVPRRATDGLDWGQAGTRATPDITSGPTSGLESPASPPAAAGAPADGDVPRPAWPAAPEADTRLPAVPPTGAPSPAAAAGRRGFGTGAVLGVAAASALLGGLISGGIVAVVTSRDDDAGADEVASAPAAQQVTIEESSALTEAVAKTRPSVVRIESTITDPGLAEQDVGSGIVLDNQGHILTNAHVVLNTDSLRVVFPNGEERPAILLGHDYPFTDLAVLQVSPGGLTPIEIGDSASLALGQTVLAIGNPLAEFDGSVTVGVVSGLNRTRNFDAVLATDLIQTDAAVNSGNSGGALVNLEGQFVGMPTAVLRSAGFDGAASVEGIAFALPANRIISVANQIIRNGGSIPHADLALEYVDIDGAVRARLPRLGLTTGALVTAVSRGGAAANAGIEPGDVISSIAGTEITEDALLLNALAPLAPGETVKVVLNRQGKIIEVDVRLGTR